MRRAVLLGMGAVGIGGLLPHASKLAIAGAKTEQNRFSEAPPPEPYRTMRVAQGETEHATLFEEEPGGPAGGSLAGAVMWRVEKIAPQYGKPVETVVKAEVDIPERQMAMKWMLSRNLDSSLPASHIVEFVFTPSAGDRDHDIHKISSLETRESADARGTPLAGLTVKVTTHFFLMGLSDRGADVERNVRLLKERPWLVLPMVYENDRRATLAFAKGDSGMRALDAAFAAWESATPSRDDDRLIRRSPLPAEIVQPPRDVVK